MRLTKVKILKQNRKEEILSLLKVGENTLLKVKTKKVLDKLSMADITTLYLFIATIDDNDDKTENKCPDCGDRLKHGAQYQECDKCIDNHKE